MPPFDVDVAKQPVVLVWEVTQACGLACDHCRAEADPDRHPDELSTAEGEALLEEAAAFGDSQLVVLSGGDPLVREDIEHLVRYGADLGLRMTLTPSGTDSLTRERVAGLRDAGLERMALSLDGARPQTHDLFRGEDASFEATLRAAQYARDVGLPVQINTTVCQSTFRELPDLRHVVADLDATLWSVFFLVPVGRGAALDPVSPERADRIMDWLHELQRETEYAIKTTEAPQYRRVALENERAAAAAADPAAADGGAVEAGSNRGESGADESGGPPSSVAGRRGGIRAGAGFVFVSHVGEIYPSGFLPKTVGNVREYSLIERYRESDLFRSLRDPDQFKGKCGACEYRNVCGGSRSRAYATMDDPLASDPLCPHVPDDWDGALPESSVAGSD